MLCYPGNKVEATISFNSMDIIGQRGHEIHNPDFIDPSPRAMEKSRQGTGETIS